MVSCLLCVFTRRYWWASPDLRSGHIWLLLHKNLSHSKQTWQTVSTNWKMRSSPVSSASQWTAPSAEPHWGMWHWVQAQVYQWLPPQWRELDPGLTTGGKLLLLLWTDWLCLLTNFECKNRCWNHTIDLHMELLYVFFHTRIRNNPEDVTLSQDPAVKFRLCELNLMCCFRPSCYVFLLYREDPGEVSYLDGKELYHANSQSSVDEKPKFALSFKDDLWVLTCIQSEFFCIVFCMWE